MPLLRIATHLSDFNADIIECLLDHGADLDESSETNYCEGRTVLECAVVNKNTELVKLLIYRQANFDENTRVLAARYGNVEILRGFEEIDRKMNRKMEWRDVSKLVFAAVNMGNIDTVKYLLNTFENQVLENADSDFKMNLAISAVENAPEKHGEGSENGKSENDILEMCQFLHAKFGPDIFGENTLNFTSALGLCLKNLYPVVAEFIIEKHPDSIRIFKNHAQSCFNTSIMYGDLEMVNFLLKSRVFGGVFGGVFDGIFSGVMAENNLIKLVNMAIRNDDFALFTKLETYGLRMDMVDLRNQESILYKVVQHALRKEGISRSNGGKPDADRVNLGLSQIEHENTDLKLFYYVLERLGHDINEESSEDDIVVKLKKSVKSRLRIDCCVRKGTVRSKRK